MSKQAPWVGFAGPADPPVGPPTRSPPCPPSAPPVDVAGVARNSPSSPPSPFPSPGVSPLRMTVDQQVGNTMQELKFSLKTGCDMNFWACIGSSHAYALKISTVSLVVIPLQNKTASNSDDLIKSLTCL